MGLSKRYALTNVGGGLNQGADITACADNEQTILENWYPRDTRLDRRDGLAIITGSTGAYFEALTNAFAYKTALASWQLVVGGLTTLGKLSGNSLTQIPFGGDAAAVPSSTKHWSFKQYKDIVYAARPGISSMLRTEGSLVLTAGIAAPTIAATMADGGGGGLIPAGDYTTKVTFYNKNTAVESNPSPTSSKVTIAANHKLTWSSIPTSTNSQVTSRRLYRTLSNQDGAWFLVATLDDNFTTTYTDNVIDDALGQQASFDNGLPPATPQFLEVWQERMWTTDKTDLYFSGLGLPEDFSEFNVISITPDDGHQIKGLLNFGDKLLVGKSNAVYAVTTIDGFAFRVSALTNDHGVFSHWSMRSAENLAFWFGGDNFYQTDGNSVRAIGDVKIRTLVSSVQPADYDLAISAVNETLGLYMTCFPTLGKIAVYQWRSDTWTVFTFTGADASTTCPSFLADFFDTNLTRVLYCNLQGGESAQLFQFGSGNYDSGRAIKCTLTTKYFGFEADQDAKIVGDIELKVTPQAETIKVTVLGDELQTLAGPATISIYSTKQWFRVPLATNGSPANAIALKLDYQGTRAVSILGYGFIITDLERRVPVSSSS